MSATSAYTPTEMMTIVASRALKNSDVCFVGIGAPSAACNLARLTHAPKLVWLAGAAGLDPRPDRVPASTLESPLWRDSVMYLEQYSDFWHYAQNGRNLGIFCVGAAQLDMYGNANNSVIGDDYHRPKVRLPGTAGLGDMGSLGKRLFYWNTSHNPRSLVEKVDFRSAAGYLDGGDERDQPGAAWPGLPAAAVAARRVLGCGVRLGHGKAVLVVSSEVPTTIGS